MEALPGVNHMCGMQYQVQVNIKDMYVLTLLTIPGLLHKHGVGLLVR